MNKLLPKVKRLVQGRLHDPFEILGLHKEGKTSIIRAYNPHAKKLYIIDPRDLSKEYLMKPSLESHFFEYKFSKQVNFKHYQIKAIYQNNVIDVYYDPYSFTTPTLTDYEIHLFAEGNYHKSYEKFGARIRTVDGIQGVSFTVWAPNAERVSVIGNFNTWDGRRHQMRVLGSSGIWDIFVPGLKENEIYKFEIKSRNGSLMQKIDPYALSAELRPKSGSVVADIEKYKWNDISWLERRSKIDPLTNPLSIYEVHLGSWMRVPEESDRFLTYRELAPKLAKHVKKLGFTHIELLPIAEHPFDQSWGYQVLSYYAPTSRFGRPEDFQYFVDYMHQQGIGVIMDWVPAHFPKDSHGLSMYDGTHLFEHQDPRLGEHKDWGTLIFNYGRNEVRNYLISNALFWLDKYHLDGLRVDAVASMLYLDYSRKQGEWIPNCFGGNENLEAIHFIKRTNEVVFNYFPNIIMSAEESTSWPAVSKPTYLGGLGFNFKWNMGWMNDFLSYIEKDPIHRKYHHNLITFALLYAFHEHFILSLSHDEVVHGKRSLLDKMPGDYWQKFANMRSLIAFMYGHPGKKLLFQGSEFGQWNEWDSSKSLDWNLLEYEPHQKLMKCISDINKIYKSEPALYEEDFSWKGFEWIDFSDSENSIISFIRWSKDYKDCLIFVCNFTPVPRHNYRVGAPFKGFYQEIFNSDSSLYFGSNLGNNGGQYTDNWSYNNRPYSLNLTLPPLSTIILKPKKQK